MSHATDRAKLERLIDSASIVVPVVLGLLAIVALVTM